MRDPLRTLGAYLPQDRRRALARGADVPERQHGAALFADLSGFTQLTERLAGRLGPLQGAEELGACLRRVFEPLIARVEEEGGSVLGFAGDAITCWFDGDGGARAVRAAVRMQHEIASLTGLPAADAEALGVRLKVAIAVGSVRRFAVGDPEDRRWDVMVGATLERLAALEQAARPDEVVADALAARDSGMRFAFTRGDAYVLRPTEPAGGDPDEPREGGADDERSEDVADGSRPHAEVVSLPLAPPVAPQEDAWPTAEAANPWVPVAARERYWAGEEPLGDFRPAGALFLRFSGIDWDGDPGAGGRLDAFVRVVQREITASGGTLVQFTVGDKGSYLYAAFGAPRAHGDDAERAVTCAMRLVSLAGAEIGGVTGLRAGVSYGAMYTGSYGSESRGTYGVLGPKTNLAARLMQRAQDGEVLCDPEVARRARRRVRFTALPMERFKGVANPIPVYRPEGFVETTTDELGPLFGRDAQRHALGRLLGELSRGHGGTLRYEGEAGVGKSRLLAWAAEGAQLHGIEVLAARPANQGSLGPLAAWRAPLRGLLALAEDVSTEQVRHAIAAHGLEEAGDVEAAMAVIAGSAPDALPAWANPLAGRSDRDAALGALTRLVTRAVGTTPRLLLVDDLHELDPPSLELLDRVAHVVGDVPLGVVAAGRPAHDEQERLLDELLRVPPRHLPGLEPEASLLVIAQTLGVPADRVPYPVATALHARSGGVALLLEELVRELMERDALRVTAGWEGVGRAGRGGRLREGRAGVEFDEQALRDLDTGLDGLLLARLDRLTAAERSAMKAASVVGVTARHAPLAHLLERDPVALESTLSPLEGPDMLEALDGAHRFRQSGMHGAAYQTLLFEQRRRMHRQMSDWYLERLSAGEPVNGQEMVEHVYHATLGERDPARIRTAVEALERWAEEQVSALALDQGLVALDRAIELLPESGDDAQGRRFRLTARSAALHARAAQLDLAHERATTVVALAESSGDPALQATAHAGLAEILVLQGAKRELRKAAAAARACARGVGGAPLAAALVAEAVRAERDGELKEALEALQEARGLWQLPDDAGRLAEADAALARLSARGGFLTRAMQHAERARAAAERIADRHLLGLAAEAAGAVAAARGDTAEAGRRLGSAQAAFEACGARFAAARTAASLAELDLITGHLRDADARAATVLDYALSWGAAPLAIHAAAVRARVAWRRGHARWSVRLLVAADAHPEIEAAIRALVVEALEEARGALAPEAYRVAMEKGAGTRIEDARHGPTTGGAVTSSLTRPRP